MPLNLAPFKKHGHETQSHSFPVKLRLKSSLLPLLSPQLQTTCECTLRGFLGGLLLFFTFWCFNLEPNLWLAPPVGTLSPHFWLRLLHQQPFCCVCLFLSRISPKGMNGSPWNFVERLIIIQGTCDPLFISVGQRDVWRFIDYFLVEL